MTKDRELLRRALEAIDWHCDGCEDMAEEIRAWLAEPEPMQDSVIADYATSEPLGSSKMEQTTKQRKPLSAKEIQQLWWDNALPLHEDEAPREQFLRFTRAVEKHHGIGNEDSVQRKPLTEEEVQRFWADNGIWSFPSFKDGVRFAEKHHGVGGGDE